MNRSSLLGEGLRDDPVIAMFVALLRNPRSKKHEQLWLRSLRSYILGAAQ